MKIPLSFSTSRASFTTAQHRLALVTLIRHASIVAALLLHTAQAADPSERDGFGGWTGKKFKATGFFRLEKGADRWWMVTPEGNAWLIHGMDHVGQDTTSQPYNREHWQKALGLAAGATYKQSEEAFYLKKVASDREYLGFNCLYSRQVPVGLNVCPYLPRVRTLDIEYWRTWKDFTEENFLDVFAADFIERCNRSAEKNIGPGRATDPWLVAQALTDSPLLTVQMAMPHRPGFFHKSLPGTTTWPVRLRNLGAAAVGKQAYVALMKQRHGDVQHFNDCYNTAFTSWEALAAAENWRTRTDPSGNLHEEQDNEAFLLQILDRAWATQVKVIRQHDPNHLIFGDTLNLNEPISDEVIRVYVRRFPVIVYQYYGATVADHLAVMERFRRVAPDVPMFSADSSWSVKDPPRMTDTLGPQCATYEIATRRMTEVYHAAFSRPDFIGWGWCGWMDKWDVAEPEMQHGGLQDAFGKWHQPMAEAMSKFGREIFDIAQGRMK